MIALAARAAACGGDDEGDGEQRPNQPAAAAAQQQAAKNKLAPRTHIEDKVSCPGPDKPTGPACTPVDLGSGAPPAGKLLPDCDPGLYYWRAVPAATTT